MQFPCICLFLCTAQLSTATTSTVPISTNAMTDVQDDEDNAAMIATISLAVVVVILLMIIIFGAAVIYLKKR